MHKVLTKRERNLFILTLLVIFGAVIFNVLYPTIEDIKQFNKKVSLLKLKLAKYYYLSKNKEKLLQKFNQAILSFNLEKHGSAKTFSIIETLARNSNVKILEIRPQGTKKTALFEEALIEIKTEGSLQEQLKFIYEIENALLSLQIKNLQLTSKTDSPQIEGNFLILQFLFDKEKGY